MRIDRTLSPMPRSPSASARLQPAALLPRTARRLKSDGVDESSDLMKKPRYRIPTVAVLGVFFLGSMMSGAAIMGPHYMKFLPGLVTGFPKFILLIAGTSVMLVSVRTLGRRWFF